MTRLWLWTVTPSTVFSVLCHFVILYMVSIEIVSFCRIISLWNFQYRNHVHSITLMSFQIISQNLVQYKAWLDDVQRLRTVTSLHVSAVAGHHAMPAALLLYDLLCHSNFLRSRIFFSNRMMILKLWWIWIHWTAIHCFFYIKYSLYDLQVLGELQSPITAVVNM